MGSEARADLAARPTLVLDLDGTLVDTAADLISALNAIVASEGLTPIPFDQALAMVGNGARAMLARAIEANGLNAEAERLDNLTAEFIDYYSEHIADRSLPYPGVAAALDQFANAGWQLAICTNKFEGLSRLLLERLGLAGHFAVIAGQDTFGVRKPDPRHLTETIRVAGGIAQRSIMVGDSEVDVMTARAASVPVIAVAFGYSPIPAAELGADGVIDHFDHLFETAARLLSETTDEREP